MDLAVEQHGHWHPGRTSAPGYLEQCRQLTQARAEYTWLAAGSQMVQQQALRDLLARRLEEKAPGRVEKVNPRVYQPALQRVQARGPEVAREPSQLPMHCLQFRLPR